MISLEQIQLLEKKVETAITRILELQAENSLLKSSNSDLTIQNEQLVQKVADLQESVSVYEVDKDRIEQGIVSALNRLTDVENTVLKNSEKMTKVFFATENEDEACSDSLVDVIQNTETHTDPTIFHDMGVSELSLQGDDVVEEEEKENELPTQDSFDSSASAFDDDKNNSQQSNSSQFDIF
ncbi:MAG: cell division protein ZapB [Treponemataceae bacterium]